MEKITSFTIDHIRLQPGLYVSRKDIVGAETVTTFDLRLTSPNEEPVLNTAEVHTIEHLAATFLRNEPSWKEKVLYLKKYSTRKSIFFKGEAEPCFYGRTLEAEWEFLQDLGEISVLLLEPCCEGA